MVTESDASYTKTTLKYGMIGGGEGAFIGDVHRKAINFDGLAELVCGCFSSEYENTLRTGAKLGIAPERLYDHYEEMARQEGRRENTIDFVVIVTPNDTHYPMARRFLENGINVVCDKPLTHTSAQALELEQLAVERDLAFCVTYTYTGYPIVKHIRQMIANGDLGTLRFVNVEYAQDWQCTRPEKTGHKHAGWRADPAKTGLANSVGDIGSHIENMVSYMTGLTISRIAVRLDSMVVAGNLDDNGTMMVEYSGGVKGLYWCSQIAIGNDNGLRIRIFGSRASIEWNQENPNYVKIAYPDQPTRLISRGRDELYPLAQSASRVPGGHPEGYFEAFANIYRTFIGYLIKKKRDEPILPEDLDFPQAAEGLRGVVFIEKCVESSANDSAWVDFG